MRNIISLPTIVFGACLLSATSGLAAGMLTAQNGMTLYVFDKDKGDQSSCYDDCAVNWPPYVGTADEKMPDDWKLAARTDGTMQWTYDGKPVYFFKGDAAKGDAKGDGKGGVWHVIKE
jgi:predicted lipoprotein with Yx(FWY)xxD motif